MQRDDLHQWLQEKSRRFANLCIAGAIVSCLAGAVALVMSCGVIWLTLWVVLSPSTGFSGGTLMWLAGVLTIALFPLNRLTRDEDLEELDLDDDRYLIARPFGMGWAGVFSDPVATRSLGKVIASSLLTGPRFCMAGWELFQRAKILRHMQHEAASKVLWTVVRSGGKVPFETLEERYPDLDIPIAAQQLLQLHGVLLRTSRPPGIALENHLRDDIRTWCEQRTLISAEGHAE